MKLALIVASLIATKGFAALSGSVKIDGSSTVFPIMEATSEEFQKKNKEVKVTAGSSGTGGGFKKFLAKEIDIASASRGINKDESAAAEKNSIGYIELPVAYDGLTVVVNSKNDWVKTLTMEQLKNIWKQSSTVKTWKDIDASWPDRPIKFYGPGVDSGTFEYFTEHVNGEKKKIRPDVTSSEDDNILVKGVAGSKDAIAYFGFSYFDANKKTVKALTISDKASAIAPSFESIKDGSYPISRPLFIYVNHASLARPEVTGFVNFFLENAKTLVKEANYVPMTDAQYKAALGKVGAIKK